MNVQKYEAFLKTAELGSLTKAASALGYTQSGMSHILNSMEEEWGVALFVRDRAGARLTSEGLRLLPHIRGVCEAEHNLAFEVDDLRGLRGGLLRIGAFGSVALSWLPSIVKKFTLDYPNVDFELVHGENDEIVRWIFEGRVDCGFLTEPHDEGLGSVPLGNDEFLIVLPEGHPLAVRESISVDELKDEPFILPPDGLENDVTEFFRQSRIVPKVRFIGWDYATILAMVEQGLAVSMLPALALRRAPYRVVRKRLENPPCRRIAFAVRSMEKISSLTKRFIDYLKYRDEGA